MFLFQPLLENLDVAWSVKMLADNGALLRACFNNVETEILRVSVTAGESSKSARYVYQVN